MTDVQPERDQEQDPNATTPQPDENPQQRENLRDQAQRQPAKDDPAPTTGGEGSAGAGGSDGFGAGAEETDMTDTRPSQDNNAGPNDDPQDHDSLQQQARRETSKAEGEYPDEDREQPSTAPPIANPD